MAKGDYLTVASEPETYHGLDAGDGTAIEYHNEGVRRVLLDEFSRGHDILIREFKSESNSPEDTLELAEGLLVSQDCDAFKRNAELFVVFCKTKKKEDESSSWWSLLVAGAVVVIAVVGIVSNKGEVTLMTNLGFTAQDFDLMYWCAACASLGGLVRILQLRFNGNEIPNESIDATKVGLVFSRLAWLCSQLIISAAAGFVLALYFAGAFSQTPNIMARVLAFSILVGYAAPKLWLGQSKVIELVVERELDKILDKKTRIRKANKKHQEDKPENKEIPNEQMQQD